MTNDDIVARLRSVGTITDCCDAADVIELLRHDLYEARSAVAAMRSERDEARRMVCRHNYIRGGIPKLQYARMMDWDCYDHSPEEIGENIERHR